MLTEQDFLQAVRKALAISGNFDNQVEPIARALYALHKAEVDETERKYKEALHASERFRISDAATHQNDQIISAHALNKWKGQCAALTAENQQLKDALDGKWVSVEERLPEINSGFDNLSINVLGLDSMGDVYVCCAHNDLKIWWCCFTDKRIRVTHWQPLPAPPKTEEGKG